MAELPSSWLGLMIAEGDASTSLADGSVLIKLLSVIVLVAANGFFVAAEFALVGLRVSPDDGIRSRAQPGEVVRYDGLNFAVERVETRRVRRVKLEIVQTNGKEVANEPNRAHSGA